MMTLLYYNMNIGRDAQNATEIQAGLSRKWIAIDSEWMQKECGTVAVWEVGHGRAWTS